MYKILGNISAIGPIFILSEVRQVTSVLHCVTPSDGYW